jgi:hypothetical protein
MPPPKQNFTLRGGCNVLKTETNTPEMENRISAAFEDSTLYAIHTVFSLAFEHGQWWASCAACGAQWSVVDEKPGINGLGFEKVTEGDEDGHAEEETY